MTKKDYKLIAEALCDTRADLPEGNHYVTVIAEKLADKLQVDNPRFNRAKFLEATYPQVEHFYPPACYMGVSHAMLRTLADRRVSGN